MGRISSGSTISDTPWFRATGAATSSASATTDPEVDGRWLNRELAGANACEEQQVADN
jgi:hypothetical protein